MASARLAEADGLASLRASDTLADCSVEITAREIADLHHAAPVLEPGSQVSVTYLAHEDGEARLGAVRAVASMGFRPVPHLAARRIRSADELDGYLGELQRSRLTDRVFVVAGDLEEPVGPFKDALAVIGSGVLARNGIRKVGIAGYPDGHPSIAAADLRAALMDKLAALREQCQEAEIVTQFGFDAEPVLRWLARLREEGVTAPVRVGVPGPAGMAALIRMAARTGVAASASIVAKYGISLTKLFGVAGPDRFVDALASGLQPEVHGDVRLHFYTFGSVERTAAWIAGRRAVGEC